MGARAKHVYGKVEAHVGETIRARVAGGRQRNTYWTSAGHVWGASSRHVWEKGTREGKGEACVWQRRGTLWGKRSGHVWRAGKGEARIGQGKGTCGGKSRTRVEARAEHVWGKLWDM